MKTAFITRHAPTEGQLKLAAAWQDNEGRPMDLVTVGDMDAFQLNLADRMRALLADGFEAVCCVHPMTALTALACGLFVVIFENANRAAEGEKPQFEATDVHVVFNIDDLL